MYATLDDGFWLTPVRMDSPKAAGYGGDISDCVQDRLQCRVAVSLLQPSDLVFDLIMIGFQPAVSRY